MNKFLLNCKVKFERDGIEQIGTVDYIIEDSVDQLVYESMCSQCEDAKHCHEACTVCDDFLEALKGYDSDYYYIYFVRSTTSNNSYYLSESEIKEVI